MVIFIFNWEFSFIMACTIRQVQIFIPLTMHWRNTVKCYHKNYCKVEIKFCLNEDGDFYFQLVIFFHYGLYELHSFDIFQIFFFICFTQCQEIDERFVFYSRCFIHNTYLFEKLKVLTSAK